jgi:hypothetical protein
MRMCNGSRSLSGMNGSALSPSDSSPIGDFMRDTLACARDWHRAEGRGGNGLVWADKTLNCIHGQRCLLRLAYCGWLTAVGCRTHV